MAASPTVMATVPARGRNRIAVKISSWTPRAHHQDASIKAHDFAYAAGIPDPTALSQAFEKIGVLIAPLLAQPILLQTLALIFGGCCSNVYTLESILTLSSDTGTLITCLQFVFIALYTLPSQLTFTVTNPELSPRQPTMSVWYPRLKERRVPLRVWVLYAAQFAMINVLNNAAFGYKISLPLHIILRSAGPVASMLVGWVWTGKRYGGRKVASVLLLFAGVVLAALSDAGGPSSPKGAGTGSAANNVTATNAEDALVVMSSSPLFDQAPGFALLTLALFLSAGMGIWADGIYTRYGRTPKMANEQLFYGHLLSLPFFLFRYSTLWDQLSNLMVASATSSQGSMPKQTMPLGLQYPLLRWLRFDQAPKAMAYLFLNCTTQMACISGVHRLSTQTSALTVSIVLNVRKVISLLLSIYLFGNELRTGVLVGAVIVFLGGGLYGLPEKKKAASVEKKDQ